MCPWNYACTPIHSSLSLTDKLCSLAVMYLNHTTHFCLNGIKSQLLSAFILINISWNVYEIRIINLIFALRYEKTLFSLIGFLLQHSLWKYSPVHFIHLETASQSVTQSTGRRIKDLLIHPTTSRVKVLSLKIITYVERKWFRSVLILWLPLHSLRNDTILAQLIQRALLSWCPPFSLTLTIFPPPLPSSTLSAKGTHVLEASSLELSVSRTFTLHCISLDSTIGFYPCFSASLRTAWPT